MMLLRRPTDAGIVLGVKQSGTASVGAALVRFPLLTGIVSRKPRMARRVMPTPSERASDTGMVHRAAACRASVRLVHGAHDSRRRRHRLVTRLVTA